jgi:hypothetical protein
LLSLLPNTQRLGRFERRQNDGQPGRQHQLAGQLRPHRFVPVTTISISRLPRLEQTSRSRQSSTDVSAPYRAAISADRARPDVGAPNNEPDLGSGCGVIGRAGGDFEVGLAPEVFSKKCPCQLNSLRYSVQFVFIPLCMGCLCAHVSGHFCLFALLAGNYGLPC